MATEKEKIINFLNEQIRQAPIRAKDYVLDASDNVLPQRSVFVKIKSHVDSFLTKKSSNRWINLTGLRGAGKTTILYQIFHSLKGNNINRLFISLDQSSQLLNAPLDEIIASYEEILGSSLESLDKPLFLFLDEVQYDEKWAITLKSIFDRTKNVFIIATGSAALLMNKNVDIARRGIFVKLFPLNYPEYLKIKHGKFEVKGLCQKAREALFQSSDVQEVYNKMLEVERLSQSYYAGMGRLEFPKYLRYGSLPFMFSSDNETIIYDQINKTIDRVVRGDIADMGKFKPETIAKIPAILYALSNSDVTSMVKVSEKFGISRSIVSDIFDALENTEILHRIYPHGSPTSQVTNKASKYLFSSPAFRAMYYNTMGNIMPESTAIGKLYEDLVGMYLTRITDRYSGWSLTYDSGKGGADFIFGHPDRRIIIEVGVGKKDYRQVIQTSKKVKSIYNLIISGDDLSFSKENNAVKIPVRLFLLT